MARRDRRGLGGRPSAAAQRALASETDLSFAGLSDLLGEVLPEVSVQIPGPQREALEIALLLRPAGDEPPTTRAIGLAVPAGGPGVPRQPVLGPQISSSLESTDSQVPPLARTLTERLSRSLNPEAADALAVVAAADRIGVAETLAVLDHLPDPAAALDAAVVAGVVVETGDRLAIAHPLIGSAALESLPPGRRGRLYRRLAEAASDPERYAHFAALAAGIGPDPAVAAASRHDTPGVQGKHVSRTRSWRPPTWTGRPVSSRT